MLVQISFKQIRMQPTLLNLTRYGLEDSVKEINSAAVQTCQTSCQSKMLMS